MIWFVLRIQFNCDIVGRWHFIQERYVELKNPSVSDKSLNVYICERLIAQFNAETWSKLFLIKFKSKL